MKELIGVPVRNRIAVNIVGGIVKMEKNESPMISFFFITTFLLKI